MQPPTIMFGSDGQNSKAKMSSGHSRTSCAQNIQTRDFKDLPKAKHSITFDFCQVAPSCTSTCLRIAGVGEAKEENDGGFVERRGFLYPVIFFFRQSHSDHTLRTGQKKKKYGKHLQTSNVFSIKLWRVRAFATEDGGMPVDAADPLVLGVLLVCEGLVEHQSLRDFTRPVASIHLDAQKSPVVVKHVHDLSLLKGLDDPAEVNSPTVMQVYFLLFFQLSRFAWKCASGDPVLPGGHRVAELPQTLQLQEALSLFGF